MVEMKLLLLVLCLKEVVSVHPYRKGRLNVEIYR